MSDTKTPSWEWRALAMAREREMEEELAEWRARAQDRQTVNAWLATRVDALQQQLATTTTHLEAQRTATYQAVAREHTAKREMVTARQEVRAANEWLAKRVDDLQRLLATTTAQTYQAVAREHAAKREVAELKKEPP